MSFQITIIPPKVVLSADPGANLLDVLRTAGLPMDAPCGGNGRCGKCAVMVNGQKVLACRHIIDREIVVELPKREKPEIMTSGIRISGPVDPVKPGYLAAFDIGTTTVVCYLLSPEGKELAVESMLNPQQPFGADVISRIQNAIKGNRGKLTSVVRDGMNCLVETCCQRAGIDTSEIGTVSIVGNPCMQQLFFGMDVSNLAAVPFSPVLRRAEVVSAGKYLSACENAALLVIPDIDGFVGADTISCVLAAGMHRSEETVLMVDIGTNGEMVLLHKGHMVACAAAAGPALEGANIQFGMRGSIGAIDHVTKSGCHVIGDGEAIGICGSGLIDAIAVMLEQGFLNKRGRILTEGHTYHLTNNVYLTQDDIRQVQMAKGAIAAGIHLMAEHFEITMGDIDRVILAGAFGSFMNPENACRIGLLPEALSGKITTAGNIAGAGSKLLAMDKSQLSIAQGMAEQIVFLELSSLPAFQKTFAKCMTFREGN